MKTSVYLEYKSPLHLEDPPLMEVVEYITKFTGQFIHNQVKQPSYGSLQNHY